MWLYGRYEMSLIVSFTETALKNSAVNFYQQVKRLQPCQALQCVLAHLTSIDVIAAAQGASLTPDLAKASSPVTLIKVLS